MSAVDTDVAQKRARPPAGPGDAGERCTVCLDEFPRNAPLPASTFRCRECRAPLHDDCLQTLLASELRHECPHCRTVLPPTLRAAAAAARRHDGTTPPEWSVVGEDRWVTTRQHLRRRVGAGTSTDPVDVEAAEAMRHEREEEERRLEADAREYAAAMQRLEDQLAREHAAGAAAAAPAVADSDSDSDWEQPVLGVTPSSAAARRHVRSRTPFYDPHWDDSSSEEEEEEQEEEEQEEHRASDAELRAIQVAITAEARRTAASATEARQRSEHRRAAAAARTRYERAREQHRRATLTARWAEHRVGGAEDRCRQLRAEYRGLRERCERLRTERHDARLLRQRARRTATAEQQARERAAAALREAERGMTDFGGVPQPSRAGRDAPAPVLE